MADYQGGDNYVIALTPEQHSQAAQQHSQAAQHHSHAAQQHSQAAQQHAQMAQQHAEAAKGQHGQQQQGQQQGQNLSDQQIEQNVNNALDNNSTIANSDIQAKVSNHTVTLTGTVKGKQAKQTADQVAWNCPGVNDVQNNIQVKSRNQQSSKGTGTEQTNESKTAASAK